MTSSCETSGADNIEAGLNLADAGTVNYNTYYRNGYGKIQFDCSQFPTDSKNVRQAIAYCLDRNEFVRQYTGGYGTVVHSYYGLAQWEYQESKDWIDENLNTYEPNVDKAIELLEADGWTLGEDGQPYSGTGLRYKDVDGELKPLVIEWANTDGNPVSTLLATMLPESMEAAGMQLNATTMDFTTLQNAISIPATRSTTCTTWPPALPLQAPRGTTIPRIRSGCRAVTTATGLRTMSWTL